MMITANEARKLFDKSREDVDLHEAYHEAITEIDYLIKLKAADGGHEIVYSFKADRPVLSDAVRTSLMENGYKVARESGNSIRIVW